MEPTQINDQMDLAKNFVRNFQAMTEATNKLQNLQLQLITIAGATFSIYEAFGKTPSSSLVKWGFILLAGSLICGLLSVLLNYFHGWGVSAFKIFDLEKTVFNTDTAGEVKAALAEIGYIEPLIYDKKLDPAFTKGNRAKGNVTTRLLVEVGFSNASGFFAGAQFMAIIVASTALFLSLLLGS